MLMMSHGRRRRSPGFPPIFAMLLSSAFVLMLGLGKAASAMGAAAIPIWLAAIAGGVFVLRGPLGEAILRAMAAGDAERDAEGTDPAVLQELDDLRARVAELEERVDFSERLLAQARERAEVRPGETA